MTRIVDLKSILGDNDDAKLDGEKISRELLSASAALTSLSSKSRLQQAISVGSALVSACSIGKKFVNYYRAMNEKGEYIVKVTEDDQLFTIAEKWLMAALPDNKKRSLFVSSEVSSDDGSDKYEFDPNGYLHQAGNRRVKLTTSYDGTIQQEAEIAGYYVKVSTEMPESAAKDKNASRGAFLRKITFTCPSIEAREAVLIELGKQSQILTNTQPGFYTARWSGFARVSDLPIRPMNSVILKDGQMERILTHVTRFLNNKDKYDKIGVPFRTGIMLHGSPGSGKSSTAAVIANELKMNLYYLSLKSIGGDDDLIETASSIPRNSIVLLEDIDVCKAAKDREIKKEDDDNDEDRSSISMSALLNILDGFQSPPGVIFIMTTNRVDALDAAIKRPGRVDLMEHINELDTHQLTRMFEYYTGSIPENIPEITPEDKITSAEVVKIVRDHIPDTENAQEEILNFVKTKLLTKPLT